MHVLAEDSLGTFNFDSGKVSHPYDMVNSKREVMKYEDYSKNCLTQMMRAYGKEGTDKISNERIDSSSIKNI